MMFFNIYNKFLYKVINTLDVENNPLGMAQEQISLEILLDHAPGANRKI